MRHGFARTACLYEGDPKLEGPVGVAVLKPSRMTDFTDHNRFLPNARTKRPHHTMRTRRRLSARGFRGISPPAMRRCAATTGGGAWLLFAVSCVVLFTTFVNANHDPRDFSCQCDDSSSQGSIYLGNENVFDKGANGVMFAPADTPQNNTCADGFAAYWRKLSVSMPSIYNSSTVDNQTTCSQLVEKVPGGLCEFVALDVSDRSSCTAVASPATPITCAVGGNAAVLFFL